jgi:hypothetical protein
MIVALLVCDFAEHRVARSLEIEQLDRRLQQARLHPLAFARDFALEQRRQNAERGEQAPTDIGDRAADAHRAAARLPGDRHDAGQALRDLIESGALAIRAVLSETGNARQHDSRIDLAQRLVVDAQPILHVGAEILDDDIRVLHEPEKNLAPLRVLEVQRDRALVAMQVLEVRAVARAAHVLDFRRLDLDDVGAEIRKLAHAARAGAHPGQVEHAKAG